MFSSVERMIAFRYLRSRRSERLISIIAAFSLIGIALGVATLIVVMAVMNGFREEITNKILGLSGHITITSYERNLTDYEILATKVKTVKGVKEVSAIIDGQVMAMTDRNTTGAMVRGLSSVDMQSRKLIKEGIIAGNLEDFKGKDVIAIGTHLAQNLGVFIGDEITLVSPQMRSTALGSIPRLKSYIVVSIFEVGMYEYDSSFIFMPLEAAQLFFKYPDSVSGIEVVTEDANKSLAISHDIFARFEGKLRVKDWQLANASLFNALKVERTVMFLILTLIVFIAAFNIVSSLILLVNDKGKDIAILRTMGATKGMIIRIFFLCGAAVGVVGTILGFILGVGFALNIETIRKWVESLTGNRLFDPVIYFLSELPAKVEVGDVIWSVAMGLFFSIAATIYPVYKASKQDPAEALRYE
ncbi:lipoprotein-releasing ABC transporter permease subunit [Rickettsiales bacterium]|nr:lipoprotein-releasing ABC transporter permease subunit [Rickettsiales bacterium]